MALMLVCAVLLLEVQDDRTVALWFLPDRPFPDVCPSRRFLDVECPGCGLTRSLVYLSRGELISSVRMHRLGWLVAAVVLLQVPYRIVRMRSRTDTDVRIPAYLCRGVVVVLLINWAWERLR